MVNVFSSAPYGFRNRWTFVSVLVEVYRIGDFECVWGVWLERMNSDAFLIPNSMPPTAKKDYQI
jgi:hypothetical protein